MAAGEDHERLMRDYEKIRAFAEEGSGPGTLPIEKYVEYMQLGKKCADEMLCKEKRQEYLDREVRRLRKLNKGFKKRIETLEGRA
jgi:hypothetical protein